MSRRADRFALFLLVASLVIAAALRLVFPADIEFGGDQTWTFEAVRVALAGGGWPGVGMPSGVWLRNPGMSAWVFIALGWLFGAATPVELARGVAIANLGALTLLAAYAWRVVPRAKRELWCWAVAFAAVSPMSVIYQRKIWAQSMLPLFCVITIIGWRHRDRLVGAFAWGLVAMILGQIHLSGFFMAAALFMVSAWTQWRGGPVDVAEPAPRRARWGAWGLGNAVGALFLIPWFRYLGARPTTAGRDPREMIQGRFFRFWVDDALGIKQSTTLGMKAFHEFARSPMIGGQETWLAGAAGVACGVVGAWMLLRSGPRALLPWDRSETSRGVRGALLIGVLMSVPAIMIHRHYVIVTYPYEWIWLAGLALAGGPTLTAARRRLAILWVLQLALAVMLLGYLHAHQGAPEGDYGVTYGAQAPAR